MAHPLPAASPLEQTRLVSYRGDAQSGEGHEGPQPTAGRPDDRAVIREGDPMSSQQAVLAEAEVEERVAAPTPPKKKRAPKKAAGTAASTKTAAPTEGADEVVDEELEEAEPDAPEDIEEVAEEVAEDTDEPAAEEPAEAEAEETPEEAEAAPTETEEEPVEIIEALPTGALVLSLADEDDVPVTSTAITGATADPVKDYLKQIGKVALLNAAEEVELAMRIEAGLFAEEKLQTEGDKLDKELIRELKWVARDG